MPGAWRAALIMVVAWETPFTSACDERVMMMKNRGPGEGFACKENIQYWLPGFRAEVACCDFANGLAAPLPMGVDPRHSASKNSSSHLGHERST